MTTNSSRRKLLGGVKGIVNPSKSPGQMSYLWLAGTAAKRNNHLNGTILNRSKYEAWANFLLSGLQTAEFLTKLESEPDPWAKSRTVGERIKELKISYQSLSDEQKAELAAQTETELRTGLAIAARNKKEIMELIATAADP